jgi:hypothetical protein
MAYYISLVPSVNALQIAIFSDFESMELHILFLAMGVLYDGRTQGVGGAIGLFSLDFGYVFYDHA